MAVLCYVTLLVLVATSWADIEWLPIQNAAPQPSGDSNNPYKPLPQSAPPCSPSVCRAPYCRCSGTDIPGKLNVSDTPQMVLFSFQTAVNDINFARYKKLFEGRKNPNGCPRTGTFFVSHNYTDYWEVQSLYGDQHEIGDNTVTSPPAPVSLYKWISELASQRIILSRWANVEMSDVRGMRAPGLAVGGDDMLNAMSAVGLTYDSSFTTVKHIKSPDLLWPYSFDYASTQDCVSGPCPENSHRGIWEIPLVAWPDKKGTAWAVPAAVTDVQTEDDAFNLLRNKFLEHYRSSNRAPLPIVLDSMWLVTDFKFSGTLRFMQYLDNFVDVYAVTNWQALQWVRSPIPLRYVHHYGPFTCNGRPHYVCPKGQATTCQYGQDRKLVREGGSTKIHACITSCPPCYPTVDDPHGIRC